MMSENVLAKTTELNNGVKMPIFGLGVWKTNNSNAANSVFTAIEKGYRLIDTAKQYGNQPGVGAGIQQGLLKTGLNRKDLFVTSKVFNGDVGYQAALKGFKDTMNQLQLDYLDLYLIHWPVDGRYLDTWHALEELYHQGKVRAIGVSNFDTERLQDLMAHCDVTPAVNQLEFNPLNQEKDIRQLMQLQGIQLEAWSPLGGGESLNEPMIQKLADKYHKTPAQVILQWDIQQGVITIPKSVHEKRIIENSQVGNFELTQEDQAEIAKLDQAKRSLWYEDFAWHDPQNPNGVSDAVDQWDDTEKFLPKNNR